MALNAEIKNVTIITTTVSDSENTETGEKTSFLSVKFLVDGKYIETAWGFAKDFPEALPVGANVNLYVSIKAKTSVKNSTNPRLSIRLLGVSAA